MSSGEWVIRIQPILQCILRYIKNRNTFFKNLSLLNREFNQISKKYQRPYLIIPNGKELIRQRLKKLGFEDTDEFFYRMTECNGIMAGSFPLQCILNEDYLPEETKKRSDIDIYVNWPRYGAGYTPLGSYIFFTKSLREKDYQRRGTNHITDGGQITRIEDYHIPNIDIQLMEVKKPKEFIIKHFDLSICKTIFDGEYLRICDPRTLQKFGYICKNKIKQLQDPKFKAEWLTEYELAFARDEKEIISRSIKYRIEKYQKRGFTISNASIINELSSPLKIPENGFPKESIWTPRGP